MLRRLWPMLASILTVAEDLGYPLMALFVFLETGCGVPISPGDLAVLSGGIAASDGKLQLETVILVGAVAAIVGDNVGYLIGRVGGRRLLERPGPFMRQRQHVLDIADPFFERHGPKAVFFGRWLPVLRVYASWLAGGSHMRWRTFLLWNAAGGICWAISMAVAGYFGGAAAKKLLEQLGQYGIVVVALGLLGGFLFYRRSQRRRLDTLRAESLALRAESLAGMPGQAPGERAE